MAGHQRKAVMHSTHCRIVATTNRLQSPVFKMKVLPAPSHERKVSDKITYFLSLSLARFLSAPPKPYFLSCTSYKYMVSKTIATGVATTVRAVSTRHSAQSQG
jgi:hypothetical protein